MTADVLSDVLRAVHLTGAVYFDFELSSPWVLESPASAEVAGRVMPGAQRVIEYHLIARGGGWGHAVGQEPIRLGQGNLLVFPQGDAHVLSSAAGIARRSICRRSNAGRGRCHSSTSSAAAAPSGRGSSADSLAVTIAPSIRCSPRCRRCCTFRRRVPGRPRGGSGRSCRSPRASRAASPGAENVLARLSELMFVETVRRYLETLPPAQTGWLAGFRDPIIGRALAALHGGAREPWTVERLARLVGLSRSLLAGRFTEMVGHPPMQYLALWRMQLASRLLIEGGQVAEVAAAVGYESEAAFSRAFKRLLGQAPATWRGGTLLPGRLAAAGSGDVAPPGRRE